MQYPINVWDEVYWFIGWIMLAGLTYALCYKEKDIKLRQELFIFGLNFVSLILWEILNCINYRLAQSGLAQLILLFIAGLLIIITVLKNTIE